MDLLEVLTDSRVDPLEVMSELRQLFAQRTIDAIIVAFQTEDGREGFAEDFRHCAAVCRATWGEEQLWDGLNSVDSDGDTPLHHASTKGHTEVMALLIAAGATVNSVSTDGWTPFLHASYNGRLYAMQILVIAGANTAASLPDGRNAIKLLPKDFRPRRSKKK